MIDGIKSQVSTAEAAAMEKSDTADIIVGQKKWSSARRTCRTGDEGLVKGTLY